MNQEIIIKVADRCLRKSKNVTWDDLTPASKVAVKSIIRSEVWRRFTKGHGSFRSIILPLFKKMEIRYMCDGQEVEFDYDALLSLFRSFSHTMSFR